MENKIKISASIICANWMHLENDLKILEQKKIDYIHYDIMDGFFCPDYCLGTHVINVIRENTSIPSDYHLMVEEPSRIFNNFTVKKGDVFSIHYEACRSLHRDLIRIKQIGFKVGIVLNPATPLNSIEYVIEEVDTVTIMTVNSGYSGQKLVPQTIKKVEALNEWRKRENLSFEICIDGNVNKENTPRMVSAGADILIGDSTGLFIEGIPLTNSIDMLRGYIEEGFKLIK